MYEKGASYINALKEDAVKECDMSRHIPWEWGLLGILYFTDK